MRGEAGAKRKRFSEEQIFAVLKESEASETVGILTAERGIATGAVDLRRRIFAIAYRRARRAKAPLRLPANSGGASS